MVRITFTMYLIVAACITICVSLPSPVGPFKAPGKKGGAFPPGKGFPPPKPLGFKKEEPFPVPKKEPFPPPKKDPFPPPKKDSFPPPKKEPFPPFPEKKDEKLFGFGFFKRSFNPSSLFSFAPVSKGKLEPRRFIEGPDDTDDDEQSVTTSNLKGKAKKTSSVSVPDTGTLDIEALGDIIGGDAVCALARRQVISTLRATSRDVQRLGSAGNRNSIVRNAVRRAQTGMREATSGITQVAFTLLGGDEPTKESRDLIAKGFNGVKTALDTMAASRPSAAITSRITRARSSLNRAIAAGNKLVVDCAGSDPIDVDEDDSSSSSSSSTTSSRPGTIILTTSSRTESSTEAPAETSSLVGGAVATAVTPTITKAPVQT